MKEQIYSSLNSLAPTFYRSAPDDYNSFPVITYYYILNTPLFLADNSFSSERKIIFNIDVWSDSDVDDLALQVVSSMKGLKAVLRNERDISEDNVFGTRLEFEINQFV